MIEFIYGDRQTGRTTRMLQEAVGASYLNKDVKILITAANGQQLNQLEHLYWKMGGNPNNPPIFLIDKDYIKNRRLYGLNIILLFRDHYAVEDSERQLARHIESLERQLKVAAKAIDNLIEAI